MRADHFRTVKLSTAKLSTAKLSTSKLRTVNLPIRHRSSNIRGLVWIAKITVPKPRGTDSIAHCRRLMEVEKMCERD